MRPQNVFVRPRPNIWTFLTFQRPAPVDLLTRQDPLLQTLEAYAQLNLDIQDFCAVDEPEALAPQRLSALMPAGDPITSIPTNRFFMTSCWNSPTRRGTAAGGDV